MSCLFGPRVVLSLVIVSLGALVGCASSEPSRNGAAGAPGAAGTPGTAGAVGTAGASGAAGAGTAGAGSAGAGTAGANGSAGAGTSGASGSAGETGAAGSMPDAGTAGAASNPDAGDSDGSFTLPPDAAGRTAPTCATPKPSPIPSKKPTNECDFLLQSLDFDDKWSYASPPESIRVTDFGTALGYFQVNNCSPYCFSKELTIGVDIVGGGDAKQLQGEVIARFPATGPGLPITTAVGRDSLAWIQLDGPTAPPFKIMAQMVVETTTGIVPAKEIKQVGYADWLDYMKAEFKYFGIKGTEFVTTPTNVTGLGFRITAPANLPKGMEWHGVLYIDHLQMRTGMAAKDPTGAYPFGL